MVKHCHQGPKTPRDTKKKNFIIKTLGAFVSWWLIFFFGSGLSSNRVPAPQGNLKENNIGLITECQVKCQIKIIKIIKILHDNISLGSYYISL